MPKGDIDTYHEDGQWKNRPEGTRRATSTHDTKAEAQSAGREMAQDREVEHIIKNQDGKIGERNTYPRSRDPRDIEG
ncbi:MAG TPA: DUF2188 domain-containing protein [Micromonosporaceae bacterium]